MAINSSKLQEELNLAGIINNGCDSNGAVFDTNNNHIETRADVAAIVALHIANTSIREAAELSAHTRQIQASKTARAIPSWALWTQAEADAWATLNIATPLASARTSLPATLTLATARAAFVVILNILDAMWTLQKANAQMTLALRDQVWPSLPEQTAIKIK